MNVLLVGGGGREAALAWRLSMSPRIGELWVTHANPGFPSRVQTLPEGGIVKAALAAGVELVVVGPEAPLADGLVDACQEAGILAFGPTQGAAQLESSKGFAKDFMARHGIPTAAYGRFSDSELAHQAISGPCVVKADGLAAGKGVYVCTTAQEAHEAVDALFGGAFGDAGAAVVVEELMTGPEISVLALCDGEQFVTLPPAQDHKRRFDGDQGPNTGGMGAYAPAPVPQGFIQEVEETVIGPVLAGMRAEGNVFRGVLYVGLMLTPQGPRVLEFNCRFGDPECQPLLMLLNEDLLPLLEQCARGELQQKELSIRPGVSCCVVMASGGYPGPIEKGHSISGLDAEMEDVVVFHAGTLQRPDGTIVNNGGRVLGVTAFGDDFSDARTKAYAAVNQIRWEGASWRTDIGWRAMEKQK